MKYFVADHREGAHGAEEWAKAGSPVVPTFPTGAQNTFLGALDFKPVPYARVALVTDLNLDEIAGLLKKQFPGLPSELIDTYVLETAKLALKLPHDTLCQIYIDDDTAKVKVVDTELFYTLWSKQPVPAGYA
jgi:hypothetical protein